MQQLDMSSAEFLEELEKTKKFTDKVNKNFGWVYHPMAEVVEGVQLGLARHKMLYNKRYCPCFMVVEEEGKFKSADDRVCPCKPAIEKEIPQEGKCHCGIFCTPEYAKAYEEENK
jgi:ferredoxin-thioredoxin reductase catalytic subunit